MIENGVATVVQKQRAAEPVSIWDEVKTLLQKEIGLAAWKSWIAPVAFQSFDAGTLTLAVPTRFMRDWVKTHYADRIRHAWGNAAGSIARVEVVVGEAALSAPVLLDTPANANEDVESDSISSPLDPRFTFENFVVGKPNELAYAAAKRVAEGEGIAFNPLFFQGGVGLGKTHLMHAIAHSLKGKKKVLYMSAEKFMYQFVRALRFKDTMAFKEQFRSVDVLMIDDIQFICGKESTQEEFFHTFNALIDQGKQIVVSADKAPSELDGIEERLRSRLGWGLVAGIHPTTYELRLGILAQKSAMLKRDIPQDVLEFLAKKIATSVRELEGALNRLIAHAELSGRAITIDTAQDLLQDLIRASDRRVTVDDIQRKVAEHYNLRLADLHSPRRARQIARPRQVAMYLAKALTEHSLPEIGRKFGGRDHTTIIHGVRTIEAMMATDATIRDDVERLKRAIAG